VTDRQELRNLCREVLEMFRLQKLYFSTRNGDDLDVSKSAERKLKKKCEEILVPPPATLFDQVEAEDIDFCPHRWLPVETGGSMCTLCRKTRGA
jgi:hypothetical protein